MAVITIISEVKKIHPKEIALVKIGEFFHAYGKDSLSPDIFSENLEHQRNPPPKIRPLSDKNIAKIMIPIS